MNVSLIFSVLHGLRLDILLCINGLTSSYLRIGLQQQIYIPPKYPVVKICTGSYYKNSGWLYINNSHNSLLIQIIIIILKTMKEPQTLCK